MGKYKDLTNLRFGKLTVIKDIGRTKSGKVIWECLCDCGNTKNVVSNSLISGLTKSCGCFKSIITSIRMKKDLTGMRFGRLLVLKESHKDKHGKYHWSCICKCGKNITVSGGHLLSGHTQSCGCISIENNRKIKEGMIFGRLKVLSLCKTRTKDGNIKCKCICECGNITYTNSHSLLRGDTKSCGCYNRDRSSEVHSGANNWNWKGGIAYAPYCPKFNNKKKEEVRDKYYRKCLICGKTEEENGKKLSVHHIDQNKDQGCNGHEWDLVPLCSQCHGKVHSKKNEKYYKEYIKFILSWREIYT